MGFRATADIRMCVEHQPEEGGTGPSRTDDEGGGRGGAHMAVVGSMKNGERSDKRLEIRRSYTPVDLHKAMHRLHLSGVDSDVLVSTTFHRQGGCFTARTIFLQHCRPDDVPGLA